MKRNLTLFTFLLAASTLAIHADDRILFTFDKPDSATPWQTINDGVMGGRSDGRVRVNDNKNLEFFGRLSLENNGGFASVRAKSGNVTIKNDDSIVARVKGDGREYNMNLYAQPRLDGISYRQSFKTRKDEWMEVGAWVYKHFDEVGGISFLPYSEHTYQQAPYQPVSKEEFIKTGFDKDVKKETPKKFSMEIEDKKVIGRFQ